MHYHMDMKTLVASLLCGLLAAGGALRAAEQDSPSVIVFVTSTADLNTDHVLLDTFLPRWREREPGASILHCPLAPFAYTMSPEASRLTIGSIASRMGGGVPTLIIAQGDPAFFLSLELRSTRFPGTKMIAFDVRGNEARRKQYADDKALYIVVNTGVEELNAEFGGRLFPKRDRAVVLIRAGGEAQQVEEARRSILDSLPGREVVFVFDPGKQATADPLLRESPERTFVLSYNPGWYNPEGRYLTGKDYVRSISDGYGVPVFEYTRIALDGGIVGGVGLSPSRWGSTAADMALGLVLDGKEPEHWMRVASFATAFADYRELERFGSSPKLLPPGTELINQPQSAWVRYQPILQPLLACLVLALAIFAFRAIEKRRESRLLVEANARLEREVAERTRDLRSSNEELAAANTSLSDAIRRTEEMQEAVLRSAREITLGRLSASMANGLNSPLGAVRSSNEALRTVANEGEGGFVGRIIALDDDQRALFLRFARKVLLRGDYLAAGSGTGSGELARRLKAASGEDLSDIAEDLAEAGLTALDDEELRSFGGRGGREVAQALYRLAVMDRSTWIIEESVERADQTIKAVRDYAIESGAGEAVGDIDLRGTIERALLLFKGRIPRSVALATECGDAPPVRGSQSALVRVWTNLIQNALQAMPEGGRLDVSLRAEGRFAVVTVADEGVGIDPAIERRIFEPFVTTRPMAEGMGLGLALCKRSVEAMGGEIGYARREKGTEFRVRLPAAANR
jgi:signal transduction histidine kinase